MSCTYKINKPELNLDVNHEYTYDELILLIISLPQYSEFKNIDDLVFSRSSGEIRQDETIAKLSSLNITAKSSANISFNDGEPVISSEGTISTLLLIDDPRFKERTHARIALINKDMYILNLSLIYQNTEGLSEELALAKAKLEVSHWERIQKDAEQLHGLISFDFRKLLYDFTKKIEGTSLEAIGPDLYESLSNTMQEIFGSVKVNNVSSKLINNLNLKIAIEGFDEDLLVHIDKLIVDGEGNIHVFSFKTTTTPPEHWAKEKWDKYLIQASIIKRTLESLGFNPKNISLNIVPVQLKYDENFENVNLVITHRPILLNYFNKSTGGLVYKLSTSDNWVKQIITSTASFDAINNEDRAPVELQLDYLFLNQNLKVEGIILTAESWIKRNIKEGGKIKRVLLPDCDFIIYFSDNDIVKIKGGDQNPLKNVDIINEVNKRTSLLDKNEGNVLSYLFKDLQKSHDLGTSRFFDYYNYSAGFLSTTLYPYCKKHLVDKDKTENDWELIDNDVLNAANILVFQHKVTQLLDFIVLSSYNLKEKTLLKKSNEHILGDHLYTTLAAGSLVDYKPTFGNLEAVRASLIINQILPKLSGEYKLGKLHVISLEQGGQGCLYDLETVSKNLLNPIIKFMNSNPNLSVTNNLIGKDFINPLELFLMEYHKILDEPMIAKDDKELLINLEIDGLELATTDESKRSALLTLAERFPATFKLLTNLNNLDNTEGNDYYLKLVKKLYSFILRAVQYYEVRDISSVLQKMNSMDEYLLKTSRIPNKNFIAISQIYTLAINNVASKTLTDVQRMRSYFQEYYDQCGYTRLQNDVLGGQALAFDRLYARDINGNQTLTLKNPYNPTEDLKDYERVFLKKLLLDLNKIRTRMKGKFENNGKTILDSFTYADINSDKLKNYIELNGVDYFNIPLERAGKATRRQKTSIKERMERGWSLVKDAFSNGGKNAFERLVLQLSPEELEYMFSGIESWQLRNPFDLGESNRIERIGNHEFGFFETNLESLAIDFHERYYQHEELSRALVVVKAVLFLLNLLKDMTNDKETIELTQKLINDFTKVNIFGASIMEDRSKKIIAALSPLKEVVSKTLIAGNVVSAFRDVFEGIWQNSMRTINKYLTDISFVNLMHGYKNVVENSFTDKRSINIVNELCRKYRLSNIDVARISEGLKTEGGLANYDDWLYATIKRPDFLNRMVLFIAQCHKDGVWDAYSINELNELVYDWKKDKRFSIYASGDTNNPQYNALMGAYYNAVRAYNQDHPDATISFDGNETPLPEPYSLLEIQNFKDLAESIYGAYDKSVRAMYEHMALASVFGMFTTWMNGMYANYFTKPGTFSDFKLELATDSKGNLEYFDDLGNIIIKDGDKYYYQDTDVEVTEHLTRVLPVMDKVPIIVQGVWYSLRDAFKALTNNDLKNFLQNSPHDRNNLRKLLTDLLASFLVAAIIKNLLKGEYKDYMKNDSKDNPFIVNATVELLYKSTSRSFDSFKGPLNFIEWMGEDVTPPIYTLNLRLIKDFGKVLFGLKAFMSAVTGSVGAFKFALDSYKVERKKD